MIFLFLYHLRIGAGWLVNGFVQARMIIFGKVAIFIIFMVYLNILKSKVLVHWIEPTAQFRRGVTWITKILGQIAPASSVGTHLWWCYLIQLWKGFYSISNLSCFFRSVNWIVSNVTFIGPDAAKIAKKRTWKFSYPKEKTK